MKIYTIAVLVAFMTVILTAGLVAAGDDHGACSITVNADRTKGQISPMLFGNNIEWVQISDAGFSDEQSDLAANLGVGILRFPGGALSETYHWRNAVGPAELHKDNEDSYGHLMKSYFGTDEFIALCEQIGCPEKMITVNYCTGTAQEAANWVEYCNAEVPSSSDPSWKLDSYKADGKAPKGYFAWLRSELGHPKPYRVKYWEIGNEIYCRQDLKDKLTPGHGYNASEYASDIKEYASAMKVVDPTIKIGSVSVDDSLLKGWNKEILKTAGKSVDFIAPHYYSSVSNLMFEKIYSSPKASTRHIIFPTSGEYTIRVTMRIQPAKEEPDTLGKVELKIDGKAIETFFVGAAPKAYVYRGKIAQGDHDVSIEFLNKYWNPSTEDIRLLQIYKVTRQIGVLPEESIWYPEDAEQQLLFDDARALTERIRNIRSQLSEYAPSRNIEIAVTEGGLNYPRDGSMKLEGCREEDIRHSLRFKSALWQSVMLNAFIRNGVSIYCHWNLLDSGYYGVIRTLAKDDNKQVVTPCYYLLQLYSRLGGASLVDTSTVSGTYEWPESIPVPPVIDGISGNVQSGKLPRPEEVPHLDALAGRSADGKKLYIMAVNRFAKPLAVNLHIRGFSIEGAGVARTLSVQHLETRNQSVGNAHAEMDAHNEIENLEGKKITPDKVGINLSPIEQPAKDFEYTFPAYSVTMIELHGGSQ